MEANKELTVSYRRVESGRDVKSYQYVENEVQSQHETWFSGLGWSFAVTGAVVVSFLKRGLGHCAGHTSALYPKFASLSPLRVTWTLMQWGT